MVREIRFNQAINEALYQALEQDDRVYLMGLGVPDPKGVFGTTLGLQKKFGSDRVMDMPCSENAMTGVVIGSAIKGLRPVLSHQRVDFSLLGLDQLVNNAAKWHFMFGSQLSVPLVLRLIIGRGWGQGPQHSQILASWFSHIPGLKVVAPSTPSDAKGLLLAAITDDNPVVYLEHRWLHGTFGPVEEQPALEPIGRAIIRRAGSYATVITYSYMVLEALRAADTLAQQGIELEVIDLRSLKPIDWDTVLGSVTKTGRVVLADLDWYSHGFMSEISASLAERAFSTLKSPPVRIAPPDIPSPTSISLTKEYYPDHSTIVKKILEMAGTCTEKSTTPTTLKIEPAKTKHDVPDPSFNGPF